MILLTIRFGMRKQNKMIISTNSQFATYYQFIAVHFQL